MDDDKPGFTTPVPDEIDARDLAVDGALPFELTGRYFRNGPNPRPGDVAPHWFMGHGMIHGVRLRDGRAEWYRNRWVEPNTSVLDHAGRLFALVENAPPVEIDRDLGVLGPCDFGGRLTTAMTAHPKEDRDTGDLHFFGYGAVAPFLTYHRLDAGGRLVESREVAVAGPTMMHDFAITEHHVVWLDLPVVFDRELLGKTMPYRWSDTYGARIGVMPKSGASVQWFEVEPCYVFHVGNAREDAAGRVVLDAVRYSRPAWMRTWAGIGGAAEGDAPATTRLYRWTLDPATGAVAEEERDDRAVEFPTLNDARTGRANRYLYAVHGDTLVKFDEAGGPARTDSLGEGWHLGEAVFVPIEPESGAQPAEDEGWLVSIATHDQPAVASRLLVHDATDVAAGPVATVHLPRRVPAGFHGRWIGDAR
ncbi:carotenoid oxygenase family protein [Dactylosporangium sp. CA-139066]|uniref:carotenoid oxygenase family protein n=1 Tax=Dactylosporangium sp. CA-139066 TaxID=3239930 RepID=UPI003D9336CF